MTEETKALVPVTQEEPEPVRPVAQLVATNAIEMGAAQADLTSWLKNKLQDLAEEIGQIEQARAEARLHKWKTSSFSSILGKTTIRYRFYEKVLAAVEAGYTIIPNFPIDVFAIRVIRDWPEGGDQWNRGYRADYKAEKADVANEGEGKYVSPKPEYFRREETVKEQNGSTWQKNWLIPTGFRDAEFPVIAAHPQVIQATAAARDKLIFDQIGICPPTGKKRGRGDPLIIGQIIETMPAWGQPSHVASFLIAWNLNLHTL